MSKSATASPTKPAAVTEKARVSVPAPGIAARRFSVLTGGAASGTAQVSVGRLARYGIYYGMYRKHPTVRAAIDKVSKVAVNNGYTFASEDSEKSAPKRKVQKLKLFARRSNFTQLLRATVKDLYIYGEAFWWIEYTRSKEPFRAKRLHPAHVDVDLDAQGIEVSQYRYGETFGKDKGRKYQPKEVIHFRLDDPDDDARGLSLLDSLQATVATDLFAIEFNGKFFENSAQTGTIFNMKNATPDEVERNREYLNTDYVGSENAHKPLILEGDIDVKKSVSSPADMQFVEGRKLNRQDILGVLDVQPEKLGITETSNRSVGKESDNSFREESIGSIHIVLEEEINNSLILDKFGWDDVVFGMRLNSKRDLLDQMKLWKEAEMAGVISPNYIRNELGLPRAEGGDALFVQTAAGLIPLDWIDEVAGRLLGGDLKLRGPMKTPDFSSPPESESDSGDPEETADSEQDE